MVLNYNDQDFKKDLLKVGLVDVFFDNGLSFLPSNTNSSEVTIQWEGRFWIGCSVNSDHTPASSLVVPSQPTSKFLFASSCQEQEKTDVRHSAEKAYGMRNIPYLVTMKAKIEGFIVLDYARRYPEARAYLADLKSKGKIKYEYMVLRPEEGKSGLERCVEGLEVVFGGRNFGKT